MLTLSVRCHACPPLNKPCRQACGLRTGMRKEPLQAPAPPPQNDAARASRLGDGFPTCVAGTAPEGLLAPWGARRTVGSSMRSEKEPRKTVQPGFLKKRRRRDSWRLKQTPATSWRRQSVAAALRPPGKERELAKAEGKTRLRSCRLVAGQKSRQPRRVLDQRTAIDPLANSLVPKFPLCAGAVN